MDQGGLGATYDDGEIIVRQGDVGDKMFVIQKGQAQILVEKDGRETPIRVAQEGELIGEMAIFERHVRSATVRALGEVQEDSRGSVPGVPRRADHVAARPRAER
jgi:signal-transduction protein with cAMP-binding, CBS, and nucleotidyltransferase domain